MPCDKDQFDTIKKTNFSYILKIFSRSTVYVCVTEQGACPEEWGEKITSESTEVVHVETYCISGDGCAK